MLGLALLNTKHAQGVQLSLHFKATRSAKKKNCLELMVALKWMDALYIENIRAVSKLAGLKMEGS